MKKIIIALCTQWFLISAAHAQINFQDDFTQLGSATWQLSSNQASSNAGEGFLVSKHIYSDFKIKLDFFSGENSNSGIFIRCQNPQEINDKNCYEVNIFDHRPDQSGRTGAIVNVSPPKKIINSENQWNTLEIIAVDTYLKVILNGITTEETYDPNFRQGVLALQYASGKIKFKNISIESLGPKVDVTGVWKLTDFKLDDGEGNVKPWCEGSHGVIIYTEKYMSVAINCRSNPDKQVHYSGPYHIEGNVVVHNVQNYSHANYRQVFRRVVEMPSQDTLNLIGPFGKNGKAVVSWDRR